MSTAEEATPSVAEEEAVDTEDENGAEAEKTKKAEEDEAEAKAKAEAHAKEVAAEEALADEAPRERVTSGSLHFVIKKVALENALSKASATVSSKDNEPLLKSFNIEADEDELRILSTDLSLGSIAKVRVADIKEPGAICVPAQKLGSIVRSAEDGDIEFVVEESQAVLKAGRARWQINVVGAEDYPEVPRFDPTNAEEVSREKLLQAIMKVRYAASTEEVRPMLMLVAFNGERAATSDGYRLQWVEFEGLKDVQIPIFAVNNLVRLLTRTEVETVKVEQKPNHLLFQIGGDTFSTQRLFENFPDVEGMILSKAEQNDKLITIDRELLMSAVKRVQIAADEEKKQLDLEVHDGEIELRALDQNGELAIETLPAQTAVEAGRSIHVNHIFFQQMLDMNPAKQITFRLGEDTPKRRSPLYIKEGGLRSVLLQLRPEE